jgi:hypothetical protein
MVDVTPLPTLSQIRDWDTGHLRQAADSWEAEAQRWETTYEQDYRRLAETDWRGQAREAAVERAGLDLVKVRGVAWRLREAATAARYGFDQQNGAKEWALDAVVDAEQAAFRPNEDLSVADRQTGGSAATRAARQAQAQALSAQIRHRAALLIASNQEIATKITAAAGTIGEFRFDEPTGTSVRGSDKPSETERNGVVQPIDRHWKQDPPPPPNPHRPIRTGQDVKDVLDPLPDGKKKGEVKELPNTADIRRLWDYLTKNAAESPPDPDYPYPRRVLDDGTRIGLRESKKWGPTVDVWYPDRTYRKVHTPYPMISDSPTPLPIPDLPPAAPVPLQPGHSPVTLPPTQVLDHPPLPAWLQDPSPPGFHVAPHQSPPTFAWDMPDPPPMLAPSGPPIMLHVPPIQAPTPDEQRGVLGILGAIVLGGAAAIGEFAEGFR